MVSITRLVSGVSSGADFSFASLNFSSFANGRVAVINANLCDGGIADRMSVHAAGSCFDCVMAVPKAIGTFFTHRYADFRMFLRAYSSMGGSTTSRDIDRRVNEVYQFRTVLENCGDNRQTAYDRFNRLSSQTRNLFFSVDHSYLQRFRAETDPAKVETVRQEIFRECQQVVSYQRTLTAVNAFLRMFSGTIQPPVTRPGSTIPRPGITTTEITVGGTDDDAFDWDGWWDHMWGGGRPRGGGGMTEPFGVTVPRGVTTVHRGVDINIPDTVPYVQNAIPAAIQRKATEIEGLKTRFEALATPPAVPEWYNDPVMRDILTLPVFDASHPGVQNGLPALRAALAGGAGVTAALNEHRNVRHLIEKDSLEGHIATGRSWAPAKCPMCRHPEDGGIRREYLRIDTGLQDEILQFLRRAVAGGGTTT